MKKEKEQTEGVGFSITKAKRNEVAPSTQDMLGLGFNPEQNMDGVEPRLPQIGIAHQVQVFKMPGDKTVESIEGVILDSNRVNAFWEKSFSDAGAGTPPDCFSFDGIRPHGDEPRSKMCATCPFNKYGSETRNGEPGRGKACKNMRRIHIMLEGKKMPYRLTLPPSSLKSWDTYMRFLNKQEDGTEAGKITGASTARHFSTVVTHIALIKDKNKDNIAFSRALFGIASEINNLADLRMIGFLKTKLAETMRDQIIMIDEANASDSDDSDTQPDRKRPGDKF